MIISTENVSLVESLQTVQFRNLEKVVKVNRQQLHLDVCNRRLQQFSHMRSLDQHILATVPRLFCQYVCVMFCVLSRLLLTD